MKNAIHKAISAPRVRGFTLIELMTTLLVAVVIAGLAAPSMRSFMLNSRLTGTSNELLRTIQTARTEAIKRQKNVVVCLSTDPTGSNPACTSTSSSAKGWILFQDDSSNWDRESAEELIETHTFDSGTVYLVSDNDKRMSFAASGFANPAGTKTPATAVVVCDKRGNSTVGMQSTARGMAISPTGRVTALRKTSEISTLLTTIGSTCPP